MFVLLAIQGTLNGLLYHNLKASVVQYSAFFIVLLSYPYITTGKKKKQHSFDYRSFLFVCLFVFNKLMSLFLKMLSR